MQVKHRNDLNSNLNEARTKAIDPTVSIASADAHTHTHTQGWTIARVWPVQVSCLFRCQSIASALPTSQQVLTVFRVVPLEEQACR